MNFKMYLTPEERLGCWQAGFMRKMAGVGKKPSDFGFTKEAAGLPTAGDLWTAFSSGLGAMASGVSDLGTTGLGIAIAAGLPIGVVMHLADKSLKRNSRKTRELKAQRDTYRDAMAQLKNRIQNTEMFY